MSNVIIANLTIPVFPTFSDFPTLAPPGQLSYSLADSKVYFFNQATNTWDELGSGGGGGFITAVDDPLLVTGTTLSIKDASTTQKGVVLLTTDSSDTISIDKAVTPKYLQYQAQTVVENTTYNALFSDIHIHGKADTADVIIQLPDVNTIPATVVKVYEFQLTRNSAPFKMTIKAFGAQQIAYNSTTVSSFDITVKNVSFILTGDSQSIEGWTALT